MIPPPTGFAPQKHPSKPAFEPAKPVVGYEPPAPSKKQPKKLANPDLEPGASTGEWVISAIKDAIAYPWRESGWAIIIPGAVLSLIFGVGRYGTAAGYFATIFSLGYFASLYFEIIARTINGEDNLPDWPPLADWDDISSNADLKLAVTLLSYGPLLLYHFACPAEWRSDWAGLALFAYAICYHPMACIRAMLGSGEFSSSVMPHRVIPAIIRCGPAYFLGVLPFAVIGMFAMPFEFTAFVASPNSHKLIGLLLHQSLLSILAFALTIGLITTTCSLYITLVQARITGLIARRYRNEIEDG